MDEWMLPIIQQQPTIQQTQPAVQQTDCPCLGCKIYPKAINYLGAITIAQTIIIVLLAKQKKS
jgi:hypothetical protein